jgi:hypothetical protein
MQELFAGIEQAMRDWPREDISRELPLNEQIHAQVQHLCDVIRQSTEQQMRGTSFPRAKMKIRSIYYVVRGSDRHISVCYLADGQSRTLSLHPDGGSVSKTDILVLRANNRQFLRVRDGDCTNVAIALDTLKLCSPAGLSEGELALTFPE